MYLSIWISNCIFFCLVCKDRLISCNILSILPAIQTTSYPTQSHHPSPPHPSPSPPPPPPPPPISLYLSPPSSLYIRQLLEEYIHIGVFANEISLKSAFDKASDLISRQNSCHSNQLWVIYITQTSYARMCVSNYHMLDFLFNSLFRQQQINHEVAT